MLTTSPSSPKLSTLAAMICCESTSPPFLIIGPTSERNSEYEISPLPSVSTFWSIVLSSALVSFLPIASNAEPSSDAEICPSPDWSNMPKTSVAFLSCSALSP